MEISVQIVGSSGETLERTNGKTLYFANSSYGLFHNQIQMCQRSIAVINTCGHTINTFRNPAAYQKRYLNRLHSTQPDEIYFIGNGDHATTKNYFGKDFSNNCVYTFSAKDFRRKIKSNINVNLFRITHNSLKEFFQLDISHKYTVIRNTVGARIKTIMNENRWDIAYFRPSTGVLTLLLAICNHGKGVNYILTNFGFKDRRTYGTFREETFSTSMTTHVFADLAIIRILAEEFNIFSPDKDISDIIPGIKYCPN